jgi:hypothetical protein
MVRGPIGAALTLQANGASLPVTVVRTTGNTDDYDITAFSFITPIADGTPYTLSVLTPPAGQTCSVYQGASGTLPVVQGNVLVGCEYNHDLVSRSDDDAVRGSYTDSQSPSIGGSNEVIGITTQSYGEGRFVAFVSYAAGLAGNTSAHRQVFWRDTLTGQTVLVSANADGAEGNGDSWAPALSADGMVVVFESHATNLVAGDTNGVRDIFVRSAISPLPVQRVSVGPAGVQANAASYEPTVSGDGGVIAFTSDASNLSATSLGQSSSNVFRRDVAAGTNTLVSLTTSGVGAGGSRPMLSEDGQRLAFYSFASNIVSGDTNGLWDIFVHDQGTGLRSRVSLTSTGAERNTGTESASRVVTPGISGNGRYVAFATTASNMVPGDTNGMQDVFVVDTQNGAVTRASVGSSGAQGNADSPLGQGERPVLSYDGTWVAFSTASNTLGAGAGSSGVSNVVMHNNTTGETRAVTDRTTGSVGPASMTRSGAYVVFGASSALDGRFNGSGLFSRFTGVARAWWWTE